MRLDLSIVGLNPCELATNCATEVSILMTKLRGMCDLTKVPTAVSSILLLASTIHLMNLPAREAGVQLAQNMRK